jgi:hypothetical protein
MKATSKMRNIRCFFPALVFAAACASFLSGCASTREPLYRWESYEKQVYAHLRGESREAQIEAMERDAEEINANGKIAPPGFYAHLGLLHAETGHDDRAIACFEKEKARFPESAAFMDFLLNKYRR